MVTYCVFLIIILADSDDLIFFLCIRTHNQERKIIALLHTIGLLFHLRPKSISWWFLDYEFDLFVLLCCQIFFFHYLRRMMMYENEWKTIRNNKKIDKDKKKQPERNQWRIAHKRSYFKKRYATVTLSMVTKQHKRDEMNKTVL